MHNAKSKYAVNGTREFMRSTAVTEALRIWLRGEARRRIDSGRDRKRRQELIEHQQIAADTKKQVEVNRQAKDAARKAELASLIPMLDVAEIQANHTRINATEIVKQINWQRQFVEKGVIPQKTAIAAMPKADKVTQLIVAVTRFNQDILPRLQLLAAAAVTSGSLVDVEIPGLDEEMPAATSWEDQEEMDDADISHSKHNLDPSPHLPAIASSSPPRPDPLALPDDNLDDTPDGLWPAFSNANFQWPATDCYAPSSLRFVFSDEEDESSLQDDNCDTSEDEPNSPELQDDDQVVDVDNINADPLYHSQASIFEVSESAAKDDDIPSAFDDYSVIRNTCIQVFLGAAFDGMSQEAVKLMLAGYKITFKAEWEVGDQGLLRLFEEAEKPRKRKLSARVLKEEARLMETLAEMEARAGAQEDLHPDDGAIEIDSNLCARACLHLSQGSQTTYN
ncbi:hypothetical protein B0H19DRAFT_1263575 [Mycena capillaripes]|nr:hypothetical protein B0H19DRAFT_1263575 [Mycena capillaripes]